MKTRLFALLILLATPLLAAPGVLELKVERRTLDRDEVQGRRGKGGGREELTRGLHITVKNNNARAAAEGEVEWAILVNRAGREASLISSGKEKLNALGATQSAQFTVGAVPVVEQRSRDQDMEYRVIVRQGGVEVAKSISDPNFDALAKNAKSLDQEEKPRKERKK
jgi:hypothetical protein